MASRPCSRPSLTRPSSELGCRISIQAKDYDDKEYGPVTLSIIVKNSGKGTVTYVEPTLFFDFGLTVKDSKGEEVPRTRYGEHIHHSIWNFERAVVELAPGKQKEYSLVVSRAYDMTLPGTYTIAATLADYPLEHDESIPLRSNTITVKVPD